jgi:hypothetical protein
MYGALIDLKVCIDNVLTTMISLEMLSQTEEQMRIAKILAENGILMDADLLLSADILRRCAGITQAVLPFQPVFLTTSGTGSVLPRRNILNYSSGSGETVT